MINLNKLKKKDILWLFNHKCLTHHKRYLFDQGCYLKKYQQKKEKILFYDIETEDLKADYGIIFSWVIMDNDTKKMYHGLINKKDYKGKKNRGKEDKRIVKEFIQTLRKLQGDRIIGHYNKRFDNRFIRTRAVISRIKFPEFGELFTSDTWDILKQKFALSRNSLENSTLKLLGSTNKDHLSLEIKHGCLRAEKWALDYTLHHNIKDVIDTERLWNSIQKYANITDTSI